MKDVKNNNTFKNNKKIEKIFRVITNEKIKIGNTFNKLTLIKEYK